jgi:hypothetical protein
MKHLILILAMLAGCSSLRPDNGGDLGFPGGDLGFIDLGEGLPDQALIPVADLASPDLRSPADVPGAPTGVTAMSGDALATVRWSAPASDGGSPIVSYTVTATPGGMTVTTAALNATVNGLTNGVAYRFSVHATNALGDGPDSVLSAAVTPTATPTAPGAPGTPTASVSGARQILVSWTAANNNGASITRYTVTASNGGGSVSTSDGSMLQATIGNLNAGTSYTFTVTASNAIGTGPASPASTPVTATDVPGSPTAVVATATAGGKASIAFTAPSANGSAITNYTVTSSPGALVANGTSSPIVVSALTLGGNYNFTVTATNAIGTGAPSSSSNSIVAADVPNAPSSVTAVANIARGATISWMAPSSNFSAITGYTVSWSGGSKSVSASTTSTSVTGLTPGGNYSFSVTATNGVGSGPAGTSGTVTIGDVPAAPSGVMACPGPGNLRLVWNAVSNATGYSVYYGTSSSITKGGGTALNVSTPSATLPSLSNLTTYYVVVTASNSFGESGASATVSGTPHPGVHDSLFVSNYSNSFVEIFDCYSQLPDGSANAFPRILNSSAINMPYGPAVFVDAASATIFLANLRGNSILIWNNADSVNGSTAPDRTIAGDKTLLYQPEGLYYDAGTDRLYVSNGQNGSPFLIWGSGSTVNGNVAPTAQFNYGGSASSQVYVDTTTNEVYLANVYNLFVYGNASTLTGSIDNPTPTRTITLVDGDRVDGVWVDHSVSGGILWLTTLDVDLATFFSFTAPETRNGALPTQKSFSGLSWGTSTFIVNDTLFLAEYGAKQIYQWSNASSISSSRASVTPTKTVVSQSLGSAGVYYVP